MPCLSSPMSYSSPQMFWVQCGYARGAVGTHSPETGVQQTVGRGPYSGVGNLPWTWGPGCVRTRKSITSEHPKLLLATRAAVRTSNHWPCDLMSYCFFIPFLLSWWASTVKAEALFYSVCVPMPITDRAPCPPYHGMCPPPWLRSSISLPSLQYGVAVGPTSPQEDWAVVWWGHLLIFVMKGTVTDATSLCCSCFPLPFVETSMAFETIAASFVQVTSMAAASGDSRVGEGRSLVASLWD